MGREGELLRAGVLRKLLIGRYGEGARADPEQCCWGGGGVPELLGGASSTVRSAVERVRPRQREALAEGAAAGVWGRKNRSPRVLECT